MGFHQAISFETAKGSHIRHVDTLGKYYKGYQVLGHCILISEFYGSEFNFPITTNTPIPHVNQNSPAVQCDNSY